MLSPKVSARSLGLALLLMTLLTTTVSAQQRLGSPDHTPNQQQLGSPRSKIVPQPGTHPSPAPLDTSTATRDALLNKARSLSNSGNYTLAIAYAHEVLRRFGSNGAAHRILAIAYEKNGEPRNAILYYNLILEATCGSDKMSDIIRQKIIDLGGKPTC